MASDWEVIAERTISGSGLIRVPEPPNGRYVRGIILDLQVKRLPKSPYFSDKSLPPQGFFTRVTTRKLNGISETVDQTFEEQRYYYSNDSDAATLEAIRCTYKGVTQTITNLAAALGIPSLPIPTVVGLPPIDYLFDEFLIRCYADTAVIATVSWLLLDVCDNEGSRPRRLPPPPPPVPRTPQGTPLTGSEGVSPPIGGGSDPWTEPYPGDEPREIPPCATGILTIVYDYAGLVFRPATYTRPWIAPVEDVTVADIGNGESIVITAVPQDPAVCLLDPDARTSYDALVVLPGGQPDYQVLSWTFELQ